MQPAFYEMFKLEPLLKLNQTLIYKKMHKLSEESK